MKRSLTPFSWTSIWLLSAAITLLAMPHEAVASTIIGQFTINSPYVQGANVKLCWDVDPQGGGFAPNHCFKIDTTQGVVESDIAGQLAADINNTVGAGTAVASGANVQTRGYYPSQGGDNEAFMTLNYSISIAGLGASIFFNPDPTAALTADGSFDVTGPNGLNALFTAPTGTSDIALAQELSAAMNADGYATSVLGSSVNFVDPTTDPINLTVTAPGLDVGFGPTAVPEPGYMLPLLGGLACLAGSMRRNRHRQG